MRTGAHVEGKAGRKHPVKKDNGQKQKESTDKLFDKLLNTLELSKADEQQRIELFMEIVTAMFTKGLTDDKYRQEFTQRLRSEIGEYGTGA